MQWQLRQTILQSQHFQNEQLDLQTTNARLVDELREAKAQIERLQSDTAEIDSLKTTNENLQHELERATLQIDRLQSEISNIRKRHSQELEQARQTSNELGQDKLQAALKEQAAELALQHKNALQAAMDRTKAKYTKILDQNQREHQELLELEQSKRLEEVEAEKKKMRKLVKVIQKEKQRT